MKLNEFDNRGDLPLNIASEKQQDGIARTLISHKVDVNARDGKQRSLLHMAIDRGLY